MDYCISDVHGCRKTLEALLSMLGITKEDKIYFLGDYVDRGPDSKGVLDIVMNMPNAICHKGNHEDMMLKALGKTPPLYGENFWDHWLRNGGQKALDSFNDNVPTKYLDFLERLSLITQMPNFYLCHAGISNKLLFYTTEDVLLWDRDCVVDLEQTKGRRLICGHTPTPLEKIQSSLQNNKIIIDGGCVFKDYPQYGNLIALRLDDMKLFVQKNIE